MIGYLIIKNDYDDDGYYGMVKLSMMDRNVNFTNLIFISFN